LRAGFLIKTCILHALPSHLRFFSLATTVRFRIFGLPTTLIVATPLFLLSAMLLVLLAPRLLGPTGSVGSALVRFVLVLLFFGFSFLVFAAQAGLFPESCSGVYAIVLETGSFFFPLLFSFS